MLTDSNFFANLYRSTSGGNFHHSKPMGSNYEFRETFKEDLRKYELQSTKHNLPRV